MNFYSLYLSRKSNDLVMTLSILKNKLNIPVKLGSSSLLVKISYCFQDGIRVPSCKKVVNIFKKRPKARVIEHKTARTLGKKIMYLPQT